MSPQALFDVWPYLAMLGALLVVPFFAVAAVVLSCRKPRAAAGYNSGRVTARMIGGGR